MGVTDQGSAIAERLYSAFGQGDIDTVLSLLDESVVWELIGPDEIPYFGRYEGVDRVREFFDLLARWCIVERFEVNRITPTRDGVVAEGVEVGRFEGREQPYEMRWCHVMRVADGRIVEFTDHLDSAPMLAAWQS